MKELRISTKRRAVAAIVFLLAGGLHLRANAEEQKKEGEENIGETNAAVAAPSWHDRVALSYFGVYAGPALSRPGDGGTINTTTLDYDDTSPQNLYSQFKLDYNLTPNVFIGPVVNFYLIPVPNQDHFQMSDSGLRIGHKQILHTDNLNLMADFRVMAPLRPSYRARDERLDLQSLEVFTYTLPKTKWTLGVVGFHYFQVYGGGAPTRDPLDPKDPRDLNMYFAPNVSYQFTKTVAATLYYELYPYHVLNGSWLSYSADPADIAPGINWDITPTLSINPQVLIYPSRLSWNTLSPLLYVSAKIL